LSYYAGNPARLKDYITLHEFLQYLSCIFFSLFRLFSENTEKNG